MHTDGLAAGDDLMKVQLLTEGKVAQVYPLIQLLQPKLSLEAWHRFTAAHLGDGDIVERGILTVEDDRGTVFAMLTYAIDPDLSHGRALVAKDLIAVTPLDKFKRAAISALFEAVENLAKEKHCWAVHTRISEAEARKEEDALRLSLLEEGHAVDHVVLCKPLSEP